MTQDALDADALRRDFCRGRDVPCPACGYNLRNTPAATCPECGRALTLALSPLAPATGAWAVCIAGVAAPLGFAASLAAPGWFEAIRDSTRTSAVWGRADWINLGLATAVVCVAALLIRGLVVRHRWLSRRSRGRQWLIASVVALVGGATIAALVASFRLVYANDGRFF